MTRAALTLIAGAGAAVCWAGCAFVLLRSTRHRVPVVGQVVRRSRFRLPAKLDVRYRAPVPGGELRARLTAGFALADTGQPVTVYVHVADPSDVTLGPGGPGHVCAVLLGVTGLLAAAFAVRVLTL